MPLLNKFLSTRKINKKSQDCKLPIKIEIGGNNERRSPLHFGADQVRVLLFRECEWRGRKLLFDSVTAGRNNTCTANENGPKRNDGNDSCPRNGNGLPQASEKDPCDNVNLLSEMVFGTVAMTYRGPLFKVHTFDAPRCIMYTKVFPTSDHNPHRQSGRLSDDTLGTFANIDANSSNGSIRNTLSSPSSGNFSGNSLRKSSTCSSTCSGWDIDVPLLGSSQSLESNSSSGFGSLSSLRRRWLRAMSTSLSHSESDEIFGFQPCGDNSGDICDLNARRHKTRLGLAVLIKLTPGEERPMEVRLLEHAAQLEAMLNRLCYACIEPTRSKINGERKGLMPRLHQASVKCTLWLLRLLVTAENAGIPSIWHEVLLNSSASVEIRVNTLYRSFQQMCQLLSNVDTKSTNFFLSTVVTAVLTYHLGWVNTVTSPCDKTWEENVKKKYPCNPLWAQLGDLYGVLGNPAKLVHTVVTGDPEKAALINAVLTFLSYFIRSAIVEKRHETRSLSEEDVQKAVSILQKRKRKNSSMNSSKNPRASIRVKSDDRSSSSSRLEVGLRNNSSRSLKKQFELKNQRGDSSNADESKGPANLNIPRLRKTSSLHMNLDSHTSNFLKPETKLPIKLESCQDDFTDYSSCLNDLEKDSTSSSVKIIVSQIASEGFAPEKDFPRTSALDEFEQKHEWRDAESLSVAAKLSFLHSQSDGGFDTTKLYVPEETEVYFSQVEYTDDKQSQVLFTLGGEEKISAVDPPPQSSFNCQCSFAFTRVPSTSAQLPDNVLRKILQRNFPESSKSIQRPPGTSFGKERAFGFCPKCNGSGNYEGSKLLLETPTNATEVLRTCGNSVSTRGARQRRSDSLEELLEANNVVELAMPRSKNIFSVSNDFEELSGFTDTLLQRAATKPLEKSSLFNDSGYTPGLVIQGLTKKKGKRKTQKSGEQESLNVGDKEDLIAEIRDEVSVNARFPMVDQPVSEALCILADVDNWQVGIISNNMPTQSPILPVGMSRLVSDMLEAFVYLWTKYQSPVHCLNILECKLKEIWLRSEALAALLMTTDVCDVSLTSLTNALDLDAADIPLLLAVATTHSPQIAQRFGLTLT